MGDNRQGPEPMTQAPKGRGRVKAKPRPTMDRGGTSKKPPTNRASVPLSTSHHAVSVHEGEETGACQTKGAVKQRMERRAVPARGAVPPPEVKPRKTIGTCALQVLFGSE